MGKANYINNKEFYALLVEYKLACNEAEKRGTERPRIPEGVGKCFYMIASRLSSKANFIGYTYKDEMVSDALENCVMAVHNFDPEKSKNPFAYFTQIIWYAFLRRIEKEKRQTYIKYKSLEQAVIEEGMSDEQGGAYVNFDITNDKMKPIIEKYEKKKTKKVKPKGIEKFVKDNK
jgi:hypothetical protein